MNTKTATQEMIETFAEHSKQAQVSCMGYFYGEFKEKTLDHAVISKTHESNLVFRNKKNGGLALPIGSYWYKIPNAKDRLFAYFHNHSVHISLVGYMEETIYIDILSGEAFYYSYNHKTMENEQWNLGKLTKEEIAPLVPLYNRWYLDEYAKCFADDDWLERRNSDGYNDGYEFLGIHDEFSLLFRGLKNVPGGVVAVNEKHLPKNYEFKDGQWVLK